MNEQEHVTVLKKEAVEGLNIKPDGVYVDCTLGLGGHSAAIAKQLQNGRLIAFDQDAYALERAERTLAPYIDNTTFVQANFRHLKEKLNALGIEEVDGVLYDLGVSSPQFDKGERGFSYRFEGPLDMRMDQSQTLTASEVVNQWPYENLVKIFYKYGEEKFSKRIARAIEKERNIRPIETTDQLVTIVKDAIPAPARRKGGHPAKRIFQAIRIAVNDELKVFENSLKQALDMLTINGRVAVITFHSLEDRLCKNIYKHYGTPPDLPPGLPVIPESAEPPLKILTKKPIEPSEGEIEVNRRARSAKLRLAEKVRPMPREDEWK